MTDFLVKRFIKNSTDVNDPAVRTAYGNLAGAVGIFCNVLLCAAKLAVGTLFGSISITADAVNNLSDASSSVITLVGFRLSAKPADDEHPYGHARIEYLAGLAVSVLIIVIGVELARTSIWQDPVTPRPWSSACCHRGGAAALHRREAVDGGL